MLFNARAAIASGLTPIAIAVGALFAWYDPQDNSTLFQDFLGTPAALEQPVALALDKSQYRATTEKNPNPGPGFTATTGYDEYAPLPATTGPTLVSGAINVTANPMLFGGPSTAVTINKLYKAVVTFTLNAGVIGLTVNTFPFAAPILFDWGGGITPGTYTKVGYFVAAASGNAHVAWDSRFGGTPAADLTVTSCSIVEIAGNHIRQDTLASRLVLSARLNLLTYSEDLTQPVYTTQGATVTATKISEDNSVASRHVAYYQVPAFSIVAGTVVTGFADFAPAERTSAIIAIGNARFTSCIVDLVAKTAGAVVGDPGTCTVSTNADGSIRVTLTVTFAGADSGYLWTGASDGTQFYNGVTGNGVYCYRRQLQLGASSPTPSYQWITSAAVYDTASTFPRYLRSDGTNDTMRASITSFVASNGSYAGFACQMESFVAGGTNWGLNSDTHGDTIVWAAYDNGGANFGALLRNDAAGVIGLSQGAKDTSPHVLTVRTDGTNNTARLDATTSTIVTGLGTTTASNISLGSGALAGAGSNFANGRIYQAVLAGTLTAAQEAQMATFLGKIIGKTL